MYMEKKYKNLNYIIIINIIFIIILFILFFLITPNSHDMIFHLERIKALSNELSYINSIYDLPIHIYSTTLNNYGYASPLFYGDLFLYIPAILVCLGIDVILSYKLFLLLIVILSYISMYICSYDFFKNREIAFYSAFLYVFSSYFVNDLISRAALGECLAFIFLPIILFSYYKILIQKDNKYTSIYLIFASAGMINSHVITTYLVVICLICTTLINYKKLINNFSIIKKYFIIIILTFLLSTHFILPILEMFRETKYFVTDGTHKNILLNELIDLKSFFIPNYYYRFIKEYIFNKNEIENWLPGGFGYSIIWFISIFIFYNKKLEIYIKNICYKLILVIIILLLFCTKLLQFSWLQNLIGIIQFPWRVFIIMTFFIAILGSILIVNIKSIIIKKVSIIITLLVYCIIFFNSYLYNIGYFLQNNKLYTINYSSISVGNAEYVPSKAYNIYPDIIEGKQILNVNYADIKFDFKKYKNRYILNIENNNYNDLTFELPILMYKGYTAYSNDKSIKFKVNDSNNGLIKLHVDDFSGEIVIKYTGTNIQKISTLISIITFICLMIIFIKERRIHKHG